MGENAGMKPSTATSAKIPVKPTPPPSKHEVRPEQSIELLKALHILTRDGAMNQDSRRKLKQVYHLFNFIEPLLLKAQQEHEDVCVVDHGAGKSYLGFILYDLFFKLRAPQGKMLGVETRDELVTHSQALAQAFGFKGMEFLNLSVAASASVATLPKRIDIVTALHACDTATDDAIAFGIAHSVQHMVMCPAAKLKWPPRSKPKSPKPCTATPWLSSGATPCTRVSLAAN
jgi:Methyltransferase domain